MQLASSVHEPLKLADGTLVHADGRIEKPSSQRYIEVPNATTAQKIVASTRRKLSDMPAPPRTMNAITVVLGYTLQGLDDSEIAVAIGSTIDAIKRIKMSPAYATCYDNIVKEIIENDKQSVRQMFSNMSHKAARKVDELIDSEDDQIALAASKDALDRAGLRPVDVVQHNINMSGELKIVKVSRDVLNGGTDMVTIDVEVDKDNHE